MNRPYRALVPIVLLFVILSALFLTGSKMLTRWDADRDVLIWGNLFLFVITLLSYFIATRGLTNPNTNVFMRSIFGSIMFKFFLAIIAAFVYIAARGKELNKPALFTLMGLYLVYTFIEVGALTKSLRQRKHG